MKYTNTQNIGTKNINHQTHFKLHIFFDQIQVLENYLSDHGIENTITKTIYF